VTLTTQGESRYGTVASVDVVIKLRGALFDNLEGVLGVSVELKKVQEAGIVEKVCDD
jgi:hypothetical protein